MPTKPILVQEFFKICAPGPKLINQKLQTHQAIFRQVNSVVPNSIKAHLVDCATKGTKLLLFTDSSAWASQLRFYNPIVLKALKNQSIPPIKQIHIRIVPPEPKHNRRLKKTRTPSLEAINGIRSAGENAEEPVIKNSLVRLASTLEKRLSTT